VTDPIRVLLVDDHDLVRGGLAAILAADPGIEIVGEAADGIAAVRVACDLQPDVVLMDVEMSGGDGLTAARTVLASCPRTRVLMLTMFDLDEYVFQALRAGASGFLLKTTPSAQLVDAVKSCAAGETLLAPSVVHRLVSTYVQHPPAPPPEQGDGPLAALTPRELDVLRAIARGLSNAEISAELYLAEATVKTHVTRILAKLGLRDGVQAVVLAYETGLVLRR
jgi:DNA-binding NarL/FixJ family response regulator